MISARTAPSRGDDCGPRNSHALLVTPTVCLVAAGLLLELTAVAKAASAPVCPAGKNNALFIDNFDTSGGDEDVSLRDQLYRQVIAGAQDGIREKGTCYKSILSDLEVSKEKHDAIDALDNVTGYLNKSLSSQLRHAQKLNNSNPIAHLQVSLFFGPDRKPRVELRLSPYFEKKNDLRAFKGVGGCGEDWDVVFDEVREAVRLIAKNSQEAAIPQARARIPAKPIFVGDEVTLDACQSTTPTYDALSYKWEQEKPVPAGSELFLQEGAEGPRLRFVPSRPGHYIVKLVASAKIDPAHRVSPPNEIAFDVYEPLSISAGEGGVVEFTPLEAEGAEGTQQEAMISGTTPISRTTVGPTAKSPCSSGAEQFVLLDGRGGDRTHSWRELAARVVRWTQIAGPEVALVPSEAVPVCEHDVRCSGFCADPSKPGQYRFRVDVSVGSASAHDEVAFLVAPPPHADAGLDLKTTVGRPILLRDGGSYDSIDPSLGYFWMAKGARAPTTSHLVNPHTSQPTFVATERGTYTVRLDVTARRDFDDKHLVATDSDEVRVDVTPPPQMVVTRFALTMASADPKTAWYPQVGFRLQGSSADGWWRLSGRILTSLLHVDLDKNGGDYDSSINLFGGTSIDAMCYVGAVLGAEVSPYVSTKVSNSISTWGGGAGVEVADLLAGRWLVFADLEGSYVASDIWRLTGALGLGLVVP